MTSDTVRSARATRAWARTIFLLALLVCPGCASWEKTRSDIVDPVNSLIHVEYPQSIRNRDTEGARALFAPSLREWASHDVAQLLQPFETLHRVRCIIHDATPPNKDGVVETQCVLRLDGTGPSGPVTWRQERVIRAQRIGEQWRIISVTSGPVTLATPRTRFVDEAAERGLVATNRTRGLPDRWGRPQKYLGSGGVSVADIDGDNRDDILLISGDALRLYRNKEGSFVEATDHCGLRTPATGECRCAYFGDVDNDGDVDLFVGMLAADDQLYRNDGTGHFEIVDPSVSGLQPTQHTSSACFGDFDRDGDLDLVVISGNNMGQVTPDPPYAASNAHPNRYYRNDGRGHFTEATDAAGIGDTGWGLACAVSDYDLDGDLDLFVANDVGLDVLYQNQGDGSFENVSRAAGIVYHGSSMSADFGDVNGDGWPDLYVSGMASNSRWLLKQPGFPKPVWWPIGVLLGKHVLAVMWEMFHGNRLYLNQRDGSFAEVSAESRTDWLGWAWSSLFLDYDNDGRQDIYAANGFWSGEDSHDC